MPSIEAGILSTNSDEGQARRAGLRMCAVCGGVTLLLACAAPPRLSVSTSIRERDCRAPAAAVQARFAERDLGVQQCDGTAGWEVLFVSSDANSWIELRSTSTSWSSERSVVYEQPVGLFPGVDEDVPLEWRSDPRRLAALLFTVKAQDPKDAETPTSRVFVVRFAGNGQVCVIGRERTIDEARALADGDVSCPG
jgi:hypothetical protein